MLLASKHGSTTSIIKRINIIFPDSDKTADQENLQTNLNLHLPVRAS
jgi:hypothetical protein